MEILYTILSYKTFGQGNTPNAKFSARLSGANAGFCPCVTFDPHLIQVIMHHTPDIKVNLAGRLTNSSYVDKNGQNKNSAQMVVYGIELIPEAVSSFNKQPQQQYSAPQQQYQAPPTQYNQKVDNGMSFVLPNFPKSSVSEEDLLNEAIDEANKISGSTMEHVVFKTQDIIEEKVEEIGNEEVVDLDWLDDIDN